MDTPNLICTKEEQWSIFVGWRCTRCRNTLNDVSAVWEQCNVTTDFLLMEREVKKCSHKR